MVNTNNGTIYVGNNLYGGKVEIIESDPDYPEMNTIYVDKNTLSMKTFDYKRFSRQISTASKETSSLSPPKDKKKFLKLNLNDISILKKNTLIVNTKVLKTPQPLTRNKKF